MSGDIPIQNIFYLYLYAWNKFNEGKSFEHNPQRITNLPNLVTKILSSSTKRIIKKGLYKVYSQENQELSFVKGKINFKTSISKNLIKKGRLDCQVDKLSVNSIPNKIIKKTFEELINNKSLNKELKLEIQRLLKYFSDVDTNNSLKHYFSIFKFNNNNNYYRLSLNLCKLLMDYALPTREKGNFMFKDALDDNTMGLVFESFLRNFYRQEQNKFRVSSDRFPWNVEGDDSDLSLLQENITDITLRNTDKTLIIDAKFYNEPLQSRFGRLGIRNDHFRQIESYLLNLESREGPDSKADGMLIYPKVNHQEPIDAKFIVRGHKIFVKSLDLNTDWKAIHNQLLGFINY